MSEQLELFVNQLIEHGIKFEEAVAEFEKKLIRKALEKNKGNQSRAARLLGIHRNTLSRKILQYDLNQKPKRQRRH